MQEIEVQAGLYWAKPFLSPLPHQNYIFPPPGIKIYLPLTLLSPILPLSPYQKFFPKMTSAHIYPPPCGNGAFSNILYMQVESSKS
jgi:hypothetical protein